MPAVPGSRRGCASTTHQTEWGVRAQRRRIFQVSRHRTEASCGALGMAANIDEVSNIDVLVLVALPEESEIFFGDRFHSPTKRGSLESFQFDTFDYDDAEQHPRTELPKRESDQVLKNLASERLSDAVGIELMLTSC